METTGSALLLQETTPMRLIGSLVPRLDSNELGWVHLVFFPEPNVLWIAEKNEGLDGQMSRQIAMSLIASTEVLLAQIQALRAVRGVASRQASAMQTPQVDVGVTRDSVSVSCSGTGRSLVVTSHDDQLEVQMNEFFVRQLLKAIVDALGQFSARRCAE